MTGYFTNNETSQREVEKLGKEQIRALNNVTLCLRLKNSLHVKIKRDMHICHIIACHFRGNTLDQKAIFML